MYDYRKDLLNIIANIDTTDEGLLRGRKILNAAINLVNALPTDDKPGDHHFIIKHSATHKSETDHLRSSKKQFPKNKITKSPLNGNQYEILNKLKGIRHSLDNLKQGQQNGHDSPEKLAKRFYKITANLSQHDQAILDDQLQPIHHDLADLGLNKKPVPFQQKTNTKSVDGLVTTTNTDNKKINQSTLQNDATQHSAPFSSQKRQYVIQRELNGATLLTENGQDAGHVSESIVRKMNLTSGAIIKADIMPNDIFIHKVIRHIDHLGETIFDDEKRIATFEFGVVKKHKHHLRVTYNSNNEPLLVNGKKHAFLLDLDNPIVGNGSIVELAWYKDDPSSMRIRWTYPTENSDNSSKQEVKAQSNKITDDDRHHDHPLTKRYPDLNLHDQTVAVLVGNRQAHEDYERQIELYNGHPTIVDSFKTKKSFLKDKLKSADIVILVKSKAHHGASKAVAEFQNQLGFSFAVANTLSMGQFEDALYRASNGLPADVASMTNLK